MPNPLVPKRNATPGVTTTPPAASLQTGEIASNAFQGNLFIKKEDGTVVDVGPVKSVAGRTGAVTLTVADVSGAIAASLLGVANGVATLDASGKIPANQLPASVAGAMTYQGTWNAATNTPTLASGTGTKGFLYKVSVAGTTSIDGNAQWRLGDSIVFNGTTWDKIDGGVNEVVSVAGKTGVVSLLAADISDAGATGRTIMQAATPAAAKTALSLAVADVSGAAPLASPAFTGSPTVGGVPVLVDGNTLSGGTY
jgi:hypothetical protein